MVLIQYVYQDPLIAWEFTKNREVVEGRNIPKESFVEQFFAARKNVDLIKGEFKDKVQVDLIVRNVLTNRYSYKDNVGGVDKYINDKYNISTLLQQLS